MRLERGIVIPDDPDSVTIWPAPEPPQAPLPPSQAAQTHEAQATVISLPAGQRVHDIIVGAIGTPCDEQYVITFATTYNPNHVVLEIPCNVRATFRWVPIPGQEIFVQPWCQLHWKIWILHDGQLLDIGGSQNHSVWYRQWHPVVHIRSIDLATNRTVLNQTRYA